MHPQTRYALFRKHTRCPMSSTKSSGKKDEKLRNEHLDVAKRDYCIRPHRQQTFSKLFAPAIIRLNFVCPPVVIQESRRGYSMRPQRGHHA